MVEHDLKEKDLESPVNEVVPEIGELRNVEDGDAALEFLGRESVYADMMPNDEKELVTKIDWMIMPLMWACYFFQYLDKTLM
ncbi:hypothetical protein BJ546DRAFT_1008283, partial [Cryomyces antarcticus]